MLEGKKGKKQAFIKQAGRQQLFIVSFDCPNTLLRTLIISWTLLPGFSNQSCNSKLPFYVNFISSSRVGMRRVKMVQNISIERKLSKFCEVVNSSIFIWVRVFKNGPGTICGRQPLKILNFTFLKGCLPQILIGPLLNTLTHSQHCITPKLIMGAEPNLCKSVSHFHSK